MAFKRLRNKIREVITAIGNHSALVLDDGTNPHGTTKSDVGLSNVDNTADANKPISSPTQSALDDKADLVAGKVPIAQIPTSVQGGLKVIGTWNADTNTPDLSLLTLNQGECYQVSVSGSTSLNGESNWLAKDLACWDDSLAGNYYKLDNTDDVLSVNAQTGAVVLDTDDISEGATNKYFPEAPTDSKEYVRYNSAWQEVSQSALDDMTALMIERTTDLALTGTYQEITFDTTSLENNPSELEHNNTNTERVDIKTSGLHQLAMSFNCDNTANALKVLEAELRVNGTPVKSLVFDVTKLSEELVCRVLLSELVAGTYLTVAFREQGGGTDLTLKANSVVSITKLRGTQGEKGDTGAGANIIVQKDSVTVGTVTDTLNFEGNDIDSVVDAGSGKTTVTIASEWKPNSVPLGSLLVSGASYFVNAGAGVYVSMSGSADDSLYFNDSLNKSGSTYDGSDLAIKLHCRISANGTGGDTVGLLLDYAILKNLDDTSTTVTNVAQVNYDVSTWVQDEMNDIVLTTMTGVVSADTLMVSITRNSTGAGADGFSGAFEVIGVEVLKM